MYSLTRNRTYETTCPNDHNRFNAIQCSAAERWGLGGTAQRCQSAACQKHLLERSVI